MSLQKKPSTLSLFVDPFRKAGERPVIGAFYLSREGAGGQFVHRQVILDTLAALALPRARLISAVAFNLVCLDITFHF
jgi:hypothetical protein